MGRLGSTKGERVKISVCPWEGSWCIAPFGRSGAETERLARPKRGNSAPPPCNTVLFSLATLCLAQGREKGSIGWHGIAMAAVTIVMRRR